MQIVIDNMPPGTSEDKIREELSRFVHVGKIKLIEDDSAPAAVIGLDVGTRERAYAVVTRINGHIYRGRRLGAWLMLWGE